MKVNNLYKYIDVNNYSATPKYRQIGNAIVQAIKEGKLKKNDTLPSINELSDEFEVSRDTAEKTYRHLKKIGALGSVPGKGYFVRDVELTDQLKVLLLFNKLSPHKKIVYDAFVAKIGESAAIDLLVYNNDFSFFKKILTTRLHDYTHYIIIPHFMEGGDNVHQLINKIPKHQLVLLDKDVKGVTGDYAAIFENFEKDIFTALENALEHLKKYHTLKIIFAEYTHFPKEIITGFISFCEQYKFNHVIVHNLVEEPIQAGEVFITLMENDLVVLIERILTTGLVVGKEIGVISYNESPLKKIILNGITTISTDFNRMGVRAAEVILNKSTVHEEIPFYLNVRASL